MRTSVLALPAEITTSELARLLHHESTPKRQRLYPVVGEDRKLIGVATRQELLDMVRSGGDASLAKLLRKDVTLAYPDEPLRVVVYRMAETGITRFPVVERNGSHKLLGMVSLEDLLKARTKNLDAERRRERVLPLNLIRPFGSRSGRPAA